MESASQECACFEYRNHVYKLSPDKDNNIFTRVFYMGSAKKTIRWNTFRTSWLERKAMSAVRKAHVWARNVIDQRIVVLNAIEEVDPNRCRGLDKS